MGDVLQNNGHSLAHRIYVSRRYIGAAIKYARVTGKSQRATSWSYKR